MLHDDADDADLAAILRLSVESAAADDAEREELSAALALSALGAQGERWRAVPKTAKGPLRLRG